jgi:RNA polymerase sigma-70 factor (ECF subfamily)
MLSLSAQGSKAGGNDGSLALSELYAAYAGRCLAVALSVTRNKVWAEDAVHDAFAKMLARGEEYLRGEGAQVASYIIVSVKNAAIDILRREKRHEHRAPEDYEFAGAGGDPADAVIASDVESRLRCYVSRLSEENQTIFEMKYLLGMSDKAVASALGISENAAATRFHRLKKSLREKMRKDGYIDE